MPYEVFECTKNDADTMKNIWDANWSRDSLEAQLASIDQSPYMPILKKYISSRHNIKMLEAGCGLSRWVIYFLRQGYDIVGIDFAEHAINKIKTLYPELSISCGDVRNLQFPDNYYDIYFSFGVLEHLIEGPGAALREARRVVKPGGMLFISIPIFNNVRRSTLSIEKFIYWLRENKVLRKIMNKNEYPKKCFIEYRYGIKEFTKIISAEGLSIQEIRPFSHSYHGFFNYFIESPSFLSKKPINNILIFTAKMLKWFSPWIAPDMAIWIIKNDK